MNKRDYVFIILHYQTIEDTRRCIASIKQMDSTSNVGIVLIDNCSPNRSGLVLQEQYQSDDSIEVILTKENMGFSKANNLGCKVAEELWNPDFYIVANNDIVFEQMEFCSIVRRLYDESGFYILGPDIFNCRTGRHQSPMGKEPPSLRRAQKTIFLNAVCLKLFWITYPLMKQWFKKLDQNAEDAIDYNIQQYDVYLQGACVIFSREYAMERDSFYDPETFFFAEEAIFTSWCRKNNKRIVYSPDIKVLHNESSSTRSEQDNKRKIRFQMKNILEATKIYVQYIGMHQ